MKIEDEKQLQIPSQEKRMKKKRKQKLEVERVTFDCVSKRNLSVAIYEAQMKTTVKRKIPEKKSFQKKQSSKNVIKDRRVSRRNRVPKMS